jgi:hypothetical protein
MLEKIVHAHLRKVPFQNSNDKIHSLLLVIQLYLAMHPLYRVSINDCRVQPAMETCQILNVPLCSANNECHIFRLGCWLSTRDKFQLCFTPVMYLLFNINTNRGTIIAPIVPPHSVQELV